MATSFGGTENRLGEVMIPKSLREGFELYKQGKPFGKPDDGPRHAMFGLVVDEIEALKERVGEYDVDAIRKLREDVDALHVVLRNVLVSAGEFAKFDHDSDGRPGGSVKRKYTRRPKNGEAANV
jgi:hypothetical protein